MKAEQLIFGNLNRMKFCIEFNYVFQDFFKLNGLSYPKESKTISLVANNIIYNRNLSFFAEFTNTDCIFNLVIRDNFHLPFSLEDYFTKTDPVNKDKLIIADYKSDLNNKLNVFFDFLNEVLYSSEIKKLITTSYWTEEYYVDMWGSYK